MLKAQDILVLLKLISIGKENWSYQRLSFLIGLSASQLHSSVKRCRKLTLAREEGKRIIPNTNNLEEFIIHGLKYIFVVKRGEVTRGIPTSIAAPPMLDKLVQSKMELPPVWPDPEGEVRGISFSPLHKYAPLAAKQDNSLYELLVLVDVIRGEGAREKQIAIEELTRKFSDYANG